MARQIEQVGWAIDLTKNFIFGSARIVIADPLAVAFPVKLNDIVRTALTTANEIQTVTITGAPTGGSFTLTFRGATTAAIAWNAVAAAVQTALELLGTIGTGGVLVAGGPGPTTPYTVTFQNQLGGQNVTQMTATAAFTGGTTPAIAVTTTTPGFGQWDAQAGWVDLGPTKGGITIERNNAQQAFDVDQIYADILTLPTDWPTSVSANLAFADLDTLQYLWEGGTITIDGVTGERTLPIGAPNSLRHRRLAVLFQRQSVDGVTPGGVRAYCFRDTTRGAQASQIVHNKTGDQANPAFQWTCYPDSTVVDPYARFGTIIDQMAA
jgi:hypothetical protein